MRWGSTDPDGAILTSFDRQYRFRFLCRFHFLVVAAGPSRACLRLAEAAVRRFPAHRATV
jgi:hypothetical protein